MGQALRLPSLLCALLTLTFTFTLTFPPPLSAADAPSRLSEWRERMQPIVPLTYVAHHTGAATPITIDGRLDDPAWAAAPWTADFVDIEGDAKPKPRFRTRAKVLWDDTYLYIAAELEEPHLWGKLTAHDSVLFQDPDFEVFLDPTGDTHAYYEFEINALNTGWDLFLPKPYMDGGKANNAWEIPGLKTAVHLRGTLNNPADTDTGWTLEIAFPWTAFEPPGTLATVAPRPPREGEQWRMNFSRVEWQITTADGRYEKVPKTPEDNWAWSPQGVIDFHRPEMWGHARFTRRPASEPVAVDPIPGKPARDLALDFYYAQRDFFRTQKRWASTLAELAWTPPGPPVSANPDPKPHLPDPHLRLPAAPVFTPTADGYTFVVSFNDPATARPRTWTIRQDRRLTLD